MALNLVERVDDAVRIRHVLVSVSDKRGLDAFVRDLVQIIPAVRMYSTGGTHARIAECLGNDAQRHLTAVSEYTGQPEMQGGLVKTLDFKIYLGLLSETDNAAHAADLARTGAVAIDMVVVNLYPFQATVSQPGCSPEAARTNIDIGGPCMVRAAAKNYLRVASVTRPEDYAAIVTEMRATNGCLSFATRLSLARKAFAHTAEYDAAIAGYLSGCTVDAAAGCYRM